MQRLRVGAALALGMLAGLAGAARAGKSGNLIVDSPVAGATVELDGVEIGKTPLPPQAIAVGQHAIKVSKRGYLEVIDVVVISEGADTKFSADLFASQGVLDVSSPVEGAEVYVDGKLLGEVPLEQEIEPGRRSLRVSAQGYRDYVKVIQAVAGETVTLAAKLDPIAGKVPPPRHKGEPGGQRWYKKWWVWAIAGGVVATAVIVPVAVGGGTSDPLKDFHPDHTFDVAK